MYSWEGLFVVTLTDIDIIRASWLDPNDEFAQVVETSVVSKCPHKHSFSGLHSPIQSYFTNLWYDSWVQTFYKITTGLNFNFHLRPTFTQKTLRTAVAVYEFHVTRNCFWAGFLWKSVSFRVILLKFVHKHAGIYSSIIKLLFPGIILCLCWPNVFFFSLLLCLICCCQSYLAVKDAVWLSRRRILSVFVSEELVLWSKKNQKQKQKTEN